MTSCGPAARVAGCWAAHSLSALCAAAVRPTLEGRPRLPIRSRFRAPWFTDVTDEVGLDFVHDAGPVGSFFMPQASAQVQHCSTSTGDGLLDILLLQNGRSPGQEQSPVSAAARRPLPGREEKARGSTSPGITWPWRWATSTRWLSRCAGQQYGGIRLLVNNGDGKSFTDVTKEAGLQNPPGACRPIPGLRWDGWLDLVVVNYVGLRPPTWPCTSRSGVPDYCPRAFSRAAWPSCFASRAGQERQSAFRGRDRGRRALAKLQVPGLASAAPILTAMAGRISSSPTTQAQPLCGSIAEMVHLRRRRSSAAWRQRHGDCRGRHGVALGDVDGEDCRSLCHPSHRGNQHLWLQGPRGAIQTATKAAGVPGAGARATALAWFCRLPTTTGRSTWPWSMAACPRCRIGCARAGPHWGFYAERNFLFANDGKCGFS